MDADVKIAGIQMAPKIGGKAHNLARCLDSIRTAAREGARLVVFPECALSGYAFSSREEALPVAEPIPGPSTEAIAAACSELGVYVVVGLLERAGESLYNAAALVGPEGLVGLHRKAHLPVLGVDRFVESGDLPPAVYETEVGRIGMGICYELMFPEHARVLALLGAEIIALPTNWPEIAEFNPAYLVPARAAENHLWLVAVNRVGEEGGFVFIGRSRIAGPIGMIVADGQAYEEDVLYAQVNLALARDKHLVVLPGEYEVHPFDDRRPEFYGPLV
jgi:predicted amidohydrolase